MKNILLFTAGLLFLFTACPRTNAIETGPEWHTIDAQTAYRMMQETINYILLDVRTLSEFRERRIEGAILIPDYEIANRAEAELPNKNAVILLYCRSGRRSALAAEALAELGFKNVYDFGGILNWPYETISGD